MTDIEKFRAAVERYIAEAGITPTMFGKQFARDPRFVFELRNGREPRTAVRQRILWAMREPKATA